jgi:tetratricopeptide (TPR) repeat protein
VFALCDSKAPSHIDRIAQCHRDLKEWDEAVLMYKQEGTYKGYESHAMYSVAQTYEMAGRKEAAIKSFQEVCRRYPKTEHASNAHAHLQNEYKISATLGGATEEK